MTAYSEDELRYARPLAIAIEEDAAFLEWFLDGLPFGNTVLGARPVGKDIQAAARPKNSKNEYWFNYYCSKDSECTCKKGTGLETDMLFILAYPAGWHLGLHIEVKPPRASLRHGQAESYRHRAACWANSASRPKYVLQHADFLTMLVCAPDLQADRRIKFFDKVAFHDELRAKVKNYPDA